MTKYILALLALTISSTAYAGDKNLPGSAWGNITGPHVGGEEDGNWVFTGNITQAATIAEVNQWKLQPYMAVSFSKDTKGYEWNNKVTPAVGLAITKNIGPGVMTAGIQAVHESHFGKIYRSDDRSTTGLQVAVSYWVGWGR